MKPGRHCPRTAGTRLGLSRRGGREESQRSDPRVRVSRESGGAPDEEVGCKGLPDVGKAARAGRQAPAERGWGWGWGRGRAYPALAAAAAAAAWNQGRPSCAAGSREAPGGGVSSGWPGARGAHARAGGAKQSREAWVLGAALSREAQPSPLLPPPSPAGPPPRSLGKPFPPSPAPAPAPPPARPRAAASQPRSPSLPPPQCPAWCPAPLRCPLTQAPPGPPILDLGPVPGSALTLVPGPTGSVSGAPRAPGS